ncbi:MAG TPA: hypothetical protein VFD38_07935 [Myxococcaceae bacterium]|nr:hypothetical protein [Myxococcaceae bacterium]
MALVAVSGLLSLALPLVVAPMFRRLSESLGAAAPGGLGGALQGWFPLVLGLAPLALVAYALAVRQPLTRRRLVLVLAFVLTVLAGGMSLVAVYATLFSMAGAATGP